MAAIDSLTGAKTILIIAHRLSTVRHCNKILFLKDGGLAASGTFDEVCAKSPDFARMVALAEISGGEDSLIDETGADD
jgi:ABC-type multidrug transport system fused ATPase/permease subunit